MNPNHKHVYDGVQSTSNGGEYDWQNSP